MQTEEDKCEIKVQSYVWKSALMYLTGHYEFEIIIKNAKGKNIGQKTIYRRFSDIEILHEGLIKYNPGCRIPPLPEKSIWCNLYVNNDHSLEKRKKQIEEYLNYINNHKYLCKNPIFLIFLSDDFERYKTEYNSKSTIYDKLYSFKNYFSNFFKFGSRSIFEDGNLENQRDNILRLDKGISEVKSIIENNIKINEERTDSLKNILSVTKSLENTSLKIDQSENDEEVNSIKRGFENNSEVFFGLYDKNKIYCSMMKSNVLELINKYHIEVTGLKEIFERKDKIEETLKKLKNKKSEEFVDKNEINELEEILSNMYDQLVEEIVNFKTYREKDLLEIMKKFFKYKYEFDMEVASVFNGNHSHLKFNLNEDVKIFSEEDHFS